MEEWPDDHLDNLFRKSAEEYEVPFNADDWTDMSRRLDGYDRQTLFDRISRWGGIGALLLLLLGGLGWLAYDNQPTGPNRQAVNTVRTTARKPATPLVANNPSARSNQSQAVEPKRLQTVADSQPTKVDGELQRQQPANSANDPAGQLTTNTKADYLREEAGRKASQILDEPITSSVQQKSVSTSPGVIEKKTTRLAMVRHKAKPEKNDSGDRAIVANSIRRSTASIPHSATESTQAPVNNRSVNPIDLPAEPTGAVRPVEPDLGADTKWLASLTPALSVTSVVQQGHLFSEPTLPEVTGAAPVRSAAHRLLRLSVLVFASPDLSAIGLRNFDRPGSNAGLSVQYQITDRLSVNTGAMYSTKRYQTYASDYVWPSYMKMDVWPEGISGVCKMIDIPLNVRYDWLLRPRGDGRAPARWFASAGLTSYFIQHEVYSYEYANPADSKIRYWGWDNKKAARPGGSFEFSNINISIGYERPLTHRLSWQIEPFMKVPLKQVGYFKVKLLSTGAFVGLRYRL